MDRALLKDLVALMPRSVRARTTADVVEVLSAVPTLSLTAGTFVDGDGREHKVLALRGEVVGAGGLPAPVRIFVPKDYPVRPPRVSIRVPPGWRMSPHVAVDATTGDCSRLQYLRSWNKASSSLVGLLAAMGKEFAAASPVIPIVGTPAADPSPRPPPAMAPQPRRDTTPPAAPVAMQRSPRTEQQPPSQERRRGPVDILLNPKRTKPLLAEGLRRRRTSQRRRENALYD